MTPKWHQVVRRRLQDLADQLQIRPDEQPVFADWTPDQDQVTAARSILDEAPPPGTCKVLGPNCPWMDTEREAVETEHIIDNAYDLAYAEAWRAYPHKAWTSAGEK